MSGGEQELELAARAFGGAAAYLHAEPHGSGHIHQTWVASYGSPEAPRRRLLQRLNTAVFPDPEGLMQNLRRVCDHIQQKLRASRIGDPERRSLRLVPTRSGAWLHADSRGGRWRAFDFIEGTHSVDRVAGPEQAFLAARAFGEFAAQLSDLPGPRLADTIPHFHDLDRRLEAFERSVREDRHGRCARAEREAQRLRLALEGLEGQLSAARFAALPRRIAHHDCKLNNLLLDTRSGEAICVIDLDTVMEGSLLSDFGGLVRTATCRAAEDEADPARIDVEMDLFEALARGYLEATRGLLSAEERDLLYAAGTFHTLLDATRFLTDHLEGDVYYQIQHEGQNLDRARAQLRLAERMLERSGEMAATIERLVRVRPD